MKASVSLDRAALRSSLLAWYDRQARTLAWALAYFLAQRELPSLRRYYQELASLPRELELDETALLGCFARAFGLEDAKNPNGVDEDKMANLAAQWFRFLGQVALPIPEADMVEIQAQLNPPAKP